MQSSNDELLKLLMDTFKVELDEHVQAMTQALLELEKGNGRGDELLEKIFRNAHSLKGAARAVELEDIGELAHRLESLFSAAMDGEIALAGDIFDLIYESIDAFKLLMDNATNNGEDKIDLENLLERLESATSEDGESERKGATPTTIEQNSVEPEGDRQPEAEDERKLIAEVPDSGGRGGSEGEKLSRPEGARRSSPTLYANLTSNGDTIRVKTDKLDLLMNQSGELLVAKMISDDRLANVKTILNAINRWSKEWQSIAPVLKELSKTEENEDSVSARQNGVGQILDFVENGQERLKTVSSLMKALLKEMDADNNRINRVMEEMQDVVKQVRMLPVSTVFNSFERMVRDISKEQGKRVKLQVSGAETEIDKKILEEIKSPIIHLLRNSIDHGIESPEERLKNGKPEHGTIKLSAAQQGSNIVIEVSDDGSGIDFEKVKKVAVSRGLVSKPRTTDEAVQEADGLSEQDVISLLFNPGFSTAPIVTDISGRGVGLDVVKTNVEKLHGKIEVHSTKGAGCNFKITLPLTLTTSKNLLVKEFGQTFAIPTSAIERILWVKLDEVKTIGVEKSILFDGTPIAVAKLGTVLNLEDIASQTNTDSQSPYNLPADERKRPAIVLAVGEKRAAILVDELVEELDMVTKSLGKQLPRVRNVSGASILGTGDVVIILNPSDLIKSALQNSTRDSLVPAEAEVSQAQTILLVDDSITSRVLEQNILESVGYNVIVAEDGREALDKLAQNSVDLIVSDVQMPKIDGFELTAKLREDEKYKEMPVILVTSLDSKEDIERGIEVGADAYITKGTFDQNELLTTIEQLI